MEDKQLRLENWYLTSIDSIYTPPELVRIRLVGEVYNHSNPRHKDGKSVITSPVIDTMGRYAVTYSGSRYYLGEVNENYKSWMETHNINFDPDNPIKMIEYDEESNSKEAFVDPNQA